MLIGWLAALGLANAAGDWETLYDGKGLDAWEFRKGGWAIDTDGSMTCRMEQVKLKDGKTRTRGMGYIWSRKTYGDFELRLSYKLSEGANSGVFYRCDKKDPVQRGLEIQLMDNEGFQKTHGKRDPRKRNGSFFDAKAPSSDPSKPIGEWNTLCLICKGPSVRLSINDIQVFDVNIDDWDTPGKNPDGTTNKFKKALKDFPRKGLIGFQNHGQQVWFKDVRIRTLEPDQG
jgi:hypothetical protein